jgi:predicted O-methyltransferase YrrM
MSTIWYARLGCEVCSVEDNSEWYHKIDKRINSLRGRRVNYVYADEKIEYINFCQDDTAGFDLIMVDGNYRSECLANSLKLVRPGGIIYLDNSDKDSGPSGGDIRIAEATLRAYAAKINSHVHEITDFAPAQLFVQQGMYIYSR